MQIQLTIFGGHRVLKGIGMLTLYCLSRHICDAVPKFVFKKGSSKKSHERRDYESVDEKSLSLAMTRKTTKKQAVNNNTFLFR